MWADGLGGMKIFQLACVIVAVTVAAIVPAMTEDAPAGAEPRAAAADGRASAADAATPAASDTVETKAHAGTDEPLAPSAASAPCEPSAGCREKAGDDRASEERAKDRDELFIVGDSSSDESKPDLSYLRFYAYAEIPPDRKPADTVLDSLKDVPQGTPLQEIKRAADAFGIDFSFMRTVARIESDFDPKQRTGSYIGLFQLSNYEFEKYGSGKITNARDNAIAAAYKFATEAILFELDTHRKPTFSDLYLIHQQGWQGASEHVSHPEQIAWKSMCATDEGREKGEKWCKRAIWANTLPTIKHLWKTVDHLTSGAFVNMWRKRVNTLYARYSEAMIRAPKH
jgi:soluble lytic murein transglycosylase-like protein